MHITIAYHTKLFLLFILLGISSNLLNASEIPFECHNTLHTCITKFLENVQNNLVHWQKKHLGSPQQTIANQVTDLQTLQKSLAENLAHLHYIKQTYSSAHNNSDSSLSNEYAHALAKFILTLHHNLEIPQTDSKKLSSIHLAIINNYQHHMDQSLKELQQPIWFSKYKWPLIIGTLGLLTISGCSYHYQKPIKNYLTDHWEKLKNAWREHILSPLTIAWKTILNEINYEALITEEDIAQYTDYLEKEGTRHIESKNNGLLNIFYDNSSLPSETIKKEAKLYAEGKPSIIDNERLKYLEHSNINLLNGNFAKHYLLKANQFELLGKKGILKGETILKRIDLILALIACVPAGLLLYGTYSTFKNIFGSFFSKKAYFKRFKATLISMEKLINTHLSEKVLSYEAMGLLIFYVDKLRKLLHSIPYKEKYDLEQDLNELESFAFSPQQKMATINRMYRHYDFLTT